MLWRTPGLPLVAVLLIVLVGACSSPGRPADPPLVDTSPPGQTGEPGTHELPSDLCRQLDFGIVSEVYGEPRPGSKPAPVVTDIRVRRALGGPGIQTEEGRRPGGYVIAVIDAYATVDVASTQFDKNSIFNTVAPFPGADDLPADEIRFRQSDEETRLEMRHENLIIQVQLLTFGDNSALGPVTEQLPSLTAEFARNVFETLLGSL